jgi:hypothetical protein
MKKHNSNTVKLAALYMANAAFKYVQMYAEVVNDPLLDMHVKQMKATLAYTRCKLLGIFKK